MAWYFVEKQDKPQSALHSHGLSVFYATTMGVRVWNFKILLIGALMMHAMQIWTTDNITL